MNNQLTKAVEIVRELHAWVYAAFDETNTAEELCPDVRYDGKRIKIRLGPLLVFDSEHRDYDEMTTRACQDRVTHIMRTLQTLVQTDA